MVEVHMRQSSKIACAVGAGALVLIVAGCSGEEPDRGPMLNGIGQMPAAGSSGMAGAAGAAAVAGMGAVDVPSAGQAGAAGAAGSPLGGAGGAPDMEDPVADAATPDGP